MPGTQEGLGLLSAQMASDTVCSNLGHDIFTERFQVPLFCIYLTVGRTPSAICSRPKWRPTMHW